MSSYPRYVKPHCGECTANVIVDFARNGRTFLLYGRLQMRCQFSQTPLGRGQLRNRMFSCSPGLMNFQGPSDHMGKATDIVFQQIVRYPKAHGIHRCSFPNRAG
ncbi:hypothetical protein D3C72_2204780 [compost metagenome]